MWSYGLSGQNLTASAPHSDHPKMANGSLQLDQCSSFSTLSTLPPPIPPTQACICTPIQPCPSTPNVHISPFQTTSRSPPGPFPRSNTPSQSSTEARVYGFDLNEHWQADKDHFDNQKINGLTIRSSAFIQNLDVEGCDPLALPLAALLYQQANNHWLRKLAHGRDMYLIYTGYIAAVVFTTELLSPLRNR